MLPDGTRNTVRLQRLKDKLGNRSNASAEIEYDDAVAWLVGEEGRGVPTIIEMVNMTRLDCVVGLAEPACGPGPATPCTTPRTGGRSAPSWSTSLLCATCWPTWRPKPRRRPPSWCGWPGATDRAARGDAAEAAFRRIALAVTKYWVCKRVPVHAAEALECLGGNGYVEESGMPRLYREAPLQSIWEGSGNVAALDALRAIARQPEAVEAYFDEVGLAAGADPRLDEAVKRLQAELADPAQAEHRARRIVETMAMVLQGALLVRHGDPAVADAFTASRLGGDWGTPSARCPPA